VIMKGDSGGPLVVADNPAKPSEASNWKCIHAVASTAPIRQSDGGAERAKYAGGTEVLGWVNRRQRELAAPRVAAQYPLPREPDGPPDRTLVRSTDESFDEASHPVRAEEASY
jgi:hypothetical protein